MASIEKALDRFERSLSSGNTYEAQQMVKTAYHRTRSRRLFDDSRDLLQKASTLQLQHDQATCGTELAQILLEAYIEDRLKATEATFTRVEGILNAYSACFSASTAEISGVAKATLRWLESVHAPTHFADIVHRETAAHIWARRGLRGLRPALEYSCRSSDVEQMVEIVGPASELVDESEIGLLVIRTILVLLAVPSKDAKTKLQLAWSLLKGLQRRGCTHQDSPEVHFLTLLLEALDRGKAELTALLRAEYASVLERDPLLPKELAEIQKLYCGSRSANGGIENLFGGIMRSLLGPGG